MKTAILSAGIIFRCSTRLHRRATSHKATDGTILQNISLPQLWEIFHVAQHREYPASEAFLVVVDLLTSWALMGLKESLWCFVSPT